MPPEIAPTLPFSGQLVRLRSGGFEAFCEVLARDERRLVLSGSAEAAEEAEVVFSHPYGVICLIGSILPGDEVLAFRIREQRRLDQRRHGFRVELGRPARLKRADGSLEEVTVEDVSIVGARILSREPIEVGQPVTLTLELDGVAIALPGHVVRPGPRGFGIRFEPLPRAVDDQLGRFVIREQRRRLRGGE